MSNKLPSLYKLLGGNLIGHGTYTGQYLVGADKDDTFILNLADLPRLLEAESRLIELNNQNARLKNMLMIKEIMDSKETSSG